MQNDYCGQLRTNPDCKDSLSYDYASANMQFNSQLMKRVAINEKLKNCLYIVYSLLHLFVVFNCFETKLVLFIIF